MANIPDKTYVLLAQGHIRSARYFYFETRPDESDPLGIVFGGYEMCDTDFEIRRQAYPYFVIELGLAGLCRLKINENTHNLSYGTLAGFSPESGHCYKAQGKVPFEHYWVAFTGSKAQQLFEKSTLASNGSVAVGGEIIFIMEQIMRVATEKMPHAQQICCNYLENLLLSLAAISDGRSGGSLSRAQQTYLKCRKYIDENFSQIKSPSQVADRCGVNIRYMSRLFKQFGSASPHDYINRLKMNKGANLLLTSGMPVKQIAKVLGYEDPYHFSRNFGSFHGLSPQNYRVK